MAEALLRHLASVRGISLKAVSAGTTPGDHLNPLAVEALTEIGVSTVGLQPKLLTSELAADSEFVISMGCGVEQEQCPAHLQLTEDWELDDPAGQSIEAVRLIRDQIAERVRIFLDEVEGSRSAPQSDRPF
jgi:arsenate reductase